MNLDHYDSRRKPTKKQILTYKNVIDSHEALKRDSWKHVRSENETNPEKRYGSLWIKDGQEYWMNKETMKDIPVKMS